MIQNLVILHRSQKGAQNEGLRHSSQALLWETCLRQLAFSFDRSQLRRQLRPGDRLYEGLDAYKFCLEIICGLHSPMVGETEVLGQFRQFFKKVDYAQFEGGEIMHRLVQSWLADAKHIRERFFIGHGGQSYGAIVRRALRDSKHVTVLGTGHFVEELLPWVVGEHLTVALVGRNREKLLELVERYPQLSIDDWQSYQVPQGEKHALLIAVPLSAAELRARLEGFENAFDLIIDARAESAVDALGSSGQTLTLNDLFAEVSATARGLREKVDLAQQRIEQMMLEKRAMVHNRPFGWDDLCA